MIKNYLQKYNKRMKKTRGKNGVTPLFCGF
jgi:hypothetical protein